MRIVLRALAGAGVCLICISLIAFSFNEYVLDDFTLAFQENNFTWVFQAKNPDIISNFTSNRHLRNRSFTTTIPNPISCKDSEVCVG
jgi:hypothetical protein